MHFEACVKKGGENWEIILSRIVEKCDSDLKDSLIRSDSSGSTLILILIIQNRLYCCSTGDSRAVLIQDSSYLQLNQEHTCSVKTETERISSKGGRIERYRKLKSGPLRVWF